MCYKPLEMIEAKEEDLSSCNCEDSQSLNIDIVQVFHEGSLEKFKEY